MNFPRELVLANHPMWEVLVSIWKSKRGPKSGMVRLPGCWSGDTTWNLSLSYVEALPLQISARSLFPTEAKDPFHLPAGESGIQIYRCGWVVCSVGKLLGCSKCERKFRS